jgi:hypothetical protein
MATKCYIGIDPGKQGYIVWYDGNLYWKEIPAKFSGLYDLLHSSIELLLWPIRKTFIHQ